MSLSNKFSRSGFIAAADNSAHKIYYEDYGPKAAPAFVMVHGNAGYMFDPAHISMWNLQKHRVIVMHMRGVGGSAPAGEVDNNCYPELAEDIETIRQHLGLDKITLFGWSGGTAVSLLYAETYPQNCEGLILYGTYLGTEPELFSYYERVKDKYPAGWKRFCSAYGTTNIPDLLKRSNHAILNGTPEEKLNAVIKYEMIFEPDSVSFEEMKSRLSPHDWNRVVKNRMIYANMIENRYGLKPNQIQANLNLIAGIPVLLVNGSEDHITPPSVAENIKASLPLAKTLVLKGADHNVHEPSVQKQLGELVSRFPACIYDKRPSQKPDSGLAPE